MLNFTLTQQELKKRFAYDPDTGTFARVGWGARAKRPVGCADKDGYVCMKVGGRTYKAHRLAFLYMLGEMPAEIDHVNGVKADNRWANLRPASRAANGHNRSFGKNNTSGVKNVFFSKRVGKWWVMVTADKMRVSGGYFHDLESASRAAEKLRAELHGEYARHA